MRNIGHNLPSWDKEISTDGLQLNFLRSEKRFNSQVISHFLK